MDLFDLEENLKSIHSREDYSIPSYMIEFYKHLELAIEKIKPAEYDAIKLAEAMSNALPNSILYQSIFTKVDILQQIFSEAGESAQALTALQERIRDKIYFQNIERCMDKIIHAFKEQNHEMAIQACQEFGAFLRREHPKDTIKELQKAISAVEAFKEVRDIPFIDLYSRISKGAMQLEKEIPMAEPLSPSTIQDKILLYLQKKKNQIK